MPIGRSGKEILMGTALFPRNGFFVTDVRTYRGWYTVLASKMVGREGHVYSFEPEPINFQVLKRVVFIE